jgi:hypothetical protein
VGIGDERRVEVSSYCPEETVSVHRELPPNRLFVRDREPDGQAGRPYTRTEGVR